MRPLLNRQVLILNQSYEPMNVIPTRKAVLLMYLGKVEIIEIEPDLYVRSVSRSFPVPSIVRLVNYARFRRKRVTLSRKNVIKRDGLQCQYCGMRSHPLTVDHVMPKKRGGMDTWENLVCACVYCNNKKANRTPDEARMPLLREPTKPTYLFFIHKNITRMNDKWKPYLFLSD